MKRKIKGGLTEVSLPVFIADTSSATGDGLSGVTHSSSGLVLEYRRAGTSSWTSVTPLSKTLGTYVSGGIVADGALSGAYEVDFPNAAFAANARFVLCRIRGVANMLPVLIEIELDAVDYQDSVGFGLSRIDATISSRSSQTSLDTLDDYVDTEVAAIKAKTDLITAFPSNFGALGIGATGEILTVHLVNELAGNALSANSAVNEISTAVWDQLLEDHTAANTFGARIVRSVNSNNTVQISGGGSNHIFAVLHDAEPDSIPETAFVSGAVSARVIADGAIDAGAIAASAITDAKFATGAITATVLASSAAEEIADAVWDEAISAHLAIGSTGEALNNAGGSGNPWITDISTGYSGTQAGNILNLVKAKTDLITSETVQTTIPVTDQGQITGPLYIGDDYLTANGRQFDWTVALPSAFVSATSTCRFGMTFEDETGVASFNVVGTVADVGSGNVRLRFELLKETTSTLKAGFYRWSVEIASATGTEITKVAYNDRKLVEWREKQT